MRRMFISVLLMLALCQVSHAGVVVGGTRLVYKGGMGDASFGLENTGKESYLIQAWVEDEKGGDAQSSFLLTPPLFKMAGESSSLLRVVKVGDLVEDRESLFWLNVRAIPAVEGAIDSNRLTLSVQSRVKLIYRPESMRESQVDVAADGLEWSCSGAGLSVRNPTKHYMNFASVALAGVEVKEPGFVAPGQSKVFAVAVGSGCGVTWRIINDYGSAGRVHSPIGGR